jgi:hypothetical protein
MLERFAFTCALTLLLNVGWLAHFQSAHATSSEPTLWEHNGSVVYLVAKGSSREFYYKDPRPGMLEAGARPGSLLFRGQSVRGQYFGTAVIFDNRCGQYTYHVSGPILDGYERVVLKGQAPRIGPDCNVERYFEDILDFRLVKPIGTQQPTVSIAARTTAEFERCKIRHRILCFERRLPDHQ